MESPGSGGSRHGIGREPQDGTGEIVSLEPEADSLRVKVRAGKELLGYVVP